MFALLIAVKVKIYFRKCEGDPPKLFNPMDAEENTSLLVLKKSLEELNVFKRLGTFQLWGHSRLGYYFWDKGLKDFVALILVFIMIYYYLINKFYINK